MKKAAVATTTASGTAVSSSRITAVQSVYISAGLRTLPSSQSNPSLPLPMSAPVGFLFASGLVWLTTLIAPAAARAVVLFDNCQPSAAGGITCDTQPEGDTLLDDEAARYGLFDQASPGWSEFSPFGWDDDL